MLKQFDFSFAHSPLALNPPHPIQPDAILHTLPPEPHQLRTSGVVQSSSIKLKKVGEGQFVNITLGNSPEYGNLQVPKPTYTISNFNRQVQDSRKAPQSQRKEQTISSSKISNRHRDQAHKKVQVTGRDSQVRESKTQREQNNKGSRILNGSFQNQNTTRNPRQDTLQPQSKRTKFTAKPSSQSPDKLALVNKIEQLKSSLAQGENLSRTLGMQLQLTRQKLKVRQSEQILLQRQLQQLQRQVTAARETERALLEQRRMNDYFCEEIDKQKAEVVRYQQKNEESLRLLQQLNENITKREEKLKKDLAEQISNFSKVSTQKTELEENLRQSMQKIENLENKVQVLESERAQKQELFRKTEEDDKKRSQQYIQIITNLKITKEQANSLRISLIETSQQKDKLLVEVGKLNEENLHLKEKLENLASSSAAAAQQNSQKMKEMILNHQQAESELKEKLKISENQVQSLFYACKEGQAKLQVANCAINDHVAEIRELKQEKRTLQLQKEELKGDVRQLLAKNDQYYATIEAGKKKELELTTTLSQIQRQIITLEQRISDNITAIADRDVNIASLIDQLKNQRQKKQQAFRIIQEKNERINDLEQKLRKYDKMLGIYKEELSRLKQNKQSQWQEMRGVYEEQIAILQLKLKGFLQNKSSRSRSVVKTTRRELTEETISSGIVMQRVEMQQSEKIDDGPSQQAINQHE